MNIIKTGELITMLQECKDLLIYRSVLFNAK